MEKITDFINEIIKLKHQENFEIWYRGHSQTKYQLKPSIYRNGLIEYEDNIFKEAIISNPKEFVNFKTTIEKLVKMQHYGIPTRLLDITNNPLVALYFACNLDTKNDGEVICLKIPSNSIKYYDSDTVSVLSNLAKRPSTFKIKFDENIYSIDKFNKIRDIQYLLHEIKDEKPHFQNVIIPEHIEQVYVVKAKLDNDRIVKQDGAFLIFGINGTKKQPANIPSNWIIHNKEKKLIVRADRKQAILKELETLGISERTLFPELENQGVYLKNKYKNK